MSTTLYAIVSLLAVILSYIVWVKKLRVYFKAKKLQSLGTQNWDTAFLRSKRAHTDPEADSTVSQIIQSGNTEHINAMYAALRRNDSPMPADMPQYVQDFFNGKKALPSWADQDLIRVGEKFYIEHGFSIALILQAKSLPQCYACANGAMVLYKTGRLSEQQGRTDAYTRRLAETAQFIVNIMQPRALTDHGTGIVTAHQIRLIHASIRYYILQGEWDAEKYGQPINQMDMAGTLMAFAPLVIEGLEQMGVKISDVHKEAYIHCWRIAGYFMGVNEDLLPNNYADALKLGYAIFNDQMEASEQGQMLTQTVIDNMNQTLPTEELALIGKDLMWMLLGEEVAKVLAISPPAKDVEIKTDALLKLFAGWENMEARHAILQRIFIPISKMFLNGMLKKMNQGEKINFYIPPSLTGEWDLENATF